MPSTEVHSSLGERACAPANLLEARTRAECLSQRTPNMATGILGRVLQAPKYRKLYNTYPNVSHEHGLCLTSWRWPCWPVVPMTRGELDSAAENENACALGYGSELINLREQQRACPPIESPGALGMEPTVGSIRTHPAPTPTNTHPLGGFDLAVLDASAHLHASCPHWHLAPQREERLANQKYRELIASLAQLTSSMVHSSSQFMFNSTGPGVQHVFAFKDFNLLGVAWQDMHRRSPFKRPLHALAQQYILPLVSRLAYRGERAKVHSVVVSRNVHLAQEEVRTRAMLWHWDACQEDLVKVIVYLVKVASGKDGCMLAMVHNRTGTFYRMSPSKPWGRHISPPSVPRQWFEEVADAGYTSKCIVGGAGAMVIFNTNIIHRGSRPAPGRYRDGILFEIVPATSRSRRYLKAATEQYPSSTSASVLPQLPMRVGPGSSAQTIPRIGFGTANRRSASGPALIKSLTSFLQMGGRLIDTAVMYRNHKDIAVAIRQSAVPRSQLFIMSKLNTNTQKVGYITTRAGAIEQVEQTLADLELQYLDAMLIHLPWTLSKAEQVDVWRGLIAMQRASKVRMIGVSNFNAEQISQLTDATSVTPAINEIEYHPWVSAESHSLVRWCQNKGIIVVAYGSLGGNANKARGEAVSKVAKQHSVTSAQVLLRWALDVGVVVIPGATSEIHIKENLQTVALSWSLTSAERDMIEKSAKPKRFVRFKGLCDNSTSLLKESERGCTPKF
ncbi:hypothetical protein AB1Y20_014359 [Prymnesium parvum]|uniref:NADP-dependent oxidoreductase domain-containing protein n=1 Tax=Prymnesium parvum TaxID=97485 RepID=A0AB34IEZ6_PRYPA